MSETIVESSAKAVRDLNENVHEKLQLFMTAAKASIDGFVLTDLKGRIIELNDAAIGLYGADAKSDLVGMNSIDLVPSEERAKIEENMKNVIAKGTSGIKEMHVITRKGIKITVNYSTTLMKDTTGHPVGFLGIIRDVTERKKAEEALKVSEEKYRNLFENSNELKVMYDLNGKIAAVNKVALKYGFKANEGIGESMLKFIPKSEFTRAQKEVEKILKGKTIEGEIEIDTPKGKRTLEYISSPITEKGKITGICGSYKDVTERKKAEEEKEQVKKALLESKQKFERLFIDNPEAAVFVDPCFKVLDINPKFEDLFGYSLLEVKGKYINDLIVPKKLIKEAHELDRRTATDCASINDTIRMKKDGFVFPVSISTSPVMVEGQKKGYIAIYKDITETKRAEEQIKESKAQLQTLFDGMVDPVAIVDTNGKILEISKSVEDKSGFRKEELIGQNFLKIKIFSAKSKAIMLKNLSKRMIGVNMPPYEIEILTKDGICLPCEVNATKIQFDGKTADLVVFRDITERKKAEEALRESEEKFRTLSEKSPNMIFINKNGRIIYANKKCEEIMGYRKAEFYSSDFHFTRLHAPESLELVNSMIKNHMNNEEVRPYEYTLMSKNGKRIEAILTTKLIKYGGETAILGIVTDITERKKMEEQLKKYNENLEEIVKEKTQELKNAEKMATIGETTAMVGHDLRNPLQAIVNLVYMSEKYLEQLGCNEKEKQKIFENLKMIDEEIMYMDKIVSDLQYYAGSIKPMLVSTSLQSILNDTFRSMRITENIQVSIDIQQGFPDLTVDSMQMMRVFKNLIMNAQQAMIDGGKLTIDAFTKGDIAYIGIHDTGIGISAENQKKLFKPLFTTKAKGQGFGLAVCRKLVEAHNGKISIKSEVGKGTTFIIELPIVKQINSI